MALIRAWWTFPIYHFHNINANSSSVWIIRFRCRYQHSTCHTECALFVIRAADQISPTMQVVRNVLQMHPWYAVHKHHAYLQVKCKIHLGFHHGAWVRALGRHRCLSEVFVLSIGSLCVSCIASNVTLSLPAKAAPLRSCRLLEDAC